MCGQSNVGMCESRLDQRYLEDAPAQRYADHGSRDNDKLFEYRYERQRLGAQKPIPAGAGERAKAVEGPEPAAALGAVERGSALSHLYGTQQDDVGAQAMRGERAPRAMGSTYVPTVPVAAQTQANAAPTEPASEVPSTSTARSVAPAVDLRKAGLLATCAGCLSDNTMSCTAEGIFCSTCNNYRRC